MTPFPASAPSTMTADLKGTEMIGGSVMVFFYPYKKTTLYIKVKTPDEL